MQTMFMESQKQQAQLMATLFQKISEQKESTLLFCLQPLASNLENFVVLLHDFKKLLPVPKISGTSSLILLQSYYVCIAGCTYSKLTESHQLKMFNCLFNKIL